MSDTAYGIPDQPNAVQSVGIAINAADVLVTGNLVDDSSSVGITVSGAGALKSAATRPTATPPASRPPARARPRAATPSSTARRPNPSAPAAVGPGSPATCLRANRQCHRHRHHRGCPGVGQHRVWQHHGHQCELRWAAQLATACTVTPGGYHGHLRLDRPSRETTSTAMPRRHRSGSVLHRIGFEQRPRGKHDRGNSRPRVTLWWTTGVRQQHDRHREWQWLAD